MVIENFVRPHVDIKIHIILQRILIRGNKTKLLRMKKIKFKFVVVFFEGTPPF